MTADDVLNIFLEWQQFAVVFDRQMEDSPAVEPSPLSFDSTVADLQSDCDLRAGVALGRYLNKVFAVGATEAQWKPVLDGENRPQSERHRLM